MDGRVRWKAESAAQVVDDADLSKERLLDAKQLAHLYSYFAFALHCY